MVQTIWWVPKILLQAE
nr:unnamed protein product [Callosobruchus analis]CAI5848063.1 unnamed protein product [Callosobruchus analis]